MPTPEIKGAVETLMSHIGVKAIAHMHKPILDYLPILMRKTRNLQHSHLE